MPYLLFHLSKIASVLAAHIESAAARVNDRQLLLLEELIRKG
jgi:hypothetical protein